MITTKDIKLKETKDQKLTMLTTGGTKPVEFVIKGKPKPRDERMITTSNVEQFQRELAEKQKKTQSKIEIITAPAIIKDEEGNLISTIPETEPKKPWKLMTDEEKEVAMKERTAKMMATKAEKKKLKAIKDSERNK